MFQSLAKNVTILATLILASPAFGQNYERYRPQAIEPGPTARPMLSETPGPVTGSDKELLEQLDAVIVYDNASQVNPDETNENEVGLVLRFPDRTSLVHTEAFRRVVGAHIGKPVSLRSLNQLSRDIIGLYRRHGSNRDYRSENRSRHCPGRLLLRFVYGVEVGRMHAKRFPNL